MDDKKISIAVIKRLPRYYRYLSDLLDAGITKISSKELSERMDLTASQVRQDFNCFGGFGQQGYGYNVRKLYEEIAEILGIEQAYDVVMVGAGNMGQAVAKYDNFKRRGYNLNAIFDINPDVVGNTIAGIPVYHLDDMVEYIKTHKTDIVTLTVPAKVGTTIVDMIGGLGIKGIWNFSYADLHEAAEKYGIIVENVHLSDSLMILGYRLHTEK
ncbi:MAG: redox-sensing transcriptional repressor Rex [Ruminococcaceae bacterium]|nr:redox-sensing transcriptional repressor Rex [Oscillospiraceae bacterium]